MTKTLAEIKVGSLITDTNETTPGLGKCFVQVWQGEQIIARVYGFSARQISERLAELESAGIFTGFITALKADMTNTGKDSPTTLPSA